MNPQSTGKELRRQAQENRAQGKVIPVLQALNGLIALGEATTSDWQLAGNTLLSINEFAQAVGAFENALLLDPDDAESRYGLACARFQLGDIPAAAADFEFLAALDNNANAWTSLATIIPGCPESDHQRVFDIRRKFALSLAATAGDTWQAPLRTGDPRLKIGYLSAFFHRSNYMNPIRALINGHDREQFEICLFADDTDEDGLVWFQRGSHDCVYLTGALDNHGLIDLIRQQALDVLVDLNGYSVPARLPVLAVRVAPVGVAWFNLYATSGLPGIDWIVGDEYVIRPEEEPFYSERVRRLPQSYLSFVVGHEAPPVAAPPCLSGQDFTFGSLVSQYKITPPVLDAWSEILRRTPGSRLILANRTTGSKCNREYLVGQFEKRGLTRDRIEFLPPAEHYDFLQYYDRIDLALDAFPYNGGTTTTEAIWQGVPVLTFDGDRWASRTSRTLLMNCHLAEFVAPGINEYVESAVRLASDPDTPRRLAELRQSMRARLLESPVCQARDMVRAMEAFYRDACR